jgi:hypothetical protein
LSGVVRECTVTALLIKREGEGGNDEADKRKEKALYQHRVDSLGKAEEGVPLELLAWIERKSCCTAFADVSSIATGWSKKGSTFSLIQEADR